MGDFRAQRATFRELHASGCFAIPNPWDAGTAKYLRHLGFKALATTSAGAAFTLGLPDGGVSIEVMLAHIAAIVGATELPVNADFGRAFADDPDGVARNVAKCVETGVAGLSVEDATENDAHPLYELPLAVDRIRAARGAIDRAGAEVLLTARAECYLVGHPQPFEESLRRLQAYAAAGADVLYAPGVTKVEEIQAVVSAVAPKPVNVLMGWDLGMTMAHLARFGARRVSVGSSLARTAWTAFARAAEEIVERGSFGGFRDLIPHSELNELFRKEQAASAQGT